MASTPSVPIPQTNLIEPALEPWERIAWTKQQEQVIYRDWGIFFSYKQQTDIASRYYDKSLDIKEDDPNALYFRSICKLDMAKGEEALRDAQAAAELEPYKLRISKAIADAYYSLNEFEKLKVELHNDTRKYCGSIIKGLQHRIVIVDENFKDTLGDSLTWYFRTNEVLITNISKKLKHASYQDKRLLWKRLRDEGKCDIMSVLEKMEEFLSPRELARRERSLRVFNQIYFDRSWGDVIFMRALRDYQLCCPPEFRESTPLLQNLVATKYDIVKKFIKMLHVRSPLYNEWIHKFPNRKFGKQYRENFLNFVQYLTRRKMISVLRKIKQYRQERKVEQLANYVEQVMGDYVVLKTQRVMPWKFEFMNEVYNTLALTLADCYTIKEAINDKQRPEDLLFKLLHLRKEVKDRPTSFEFGNKSTCLVADEVDQKFLSYKKFIARLEKRMFFAKYSIERCYLWHEMARAHFKQAHYDECCQLAKKAIEQSRFCNNVLWEFLCRMLIAKSHASLHKIERCKVVLSQAYNCAILLKNQELCHFVDTVLLINEEYIDLRKKSRSTDTIRKRRLSNINIDDTTDEEVSKQNSGDVSERT